MSRPQEWSLERVFPYWVESLEALRGAIEQLTAETLSWVPRGGTNSIGYLLQHLIMVHNRDIRAAALGAEPIALPSPRGDRLAAALSKVVADTQSVLSSYSLADWGRVCGGEERSAPLRELLWNVFIEEMHHRGQIFMMMRLCGLDPPGI